MLAEPIKCRKILQLQKPESKFIQLIDSFRHFTSGFDVSLAVFSVLVFVQLLCNMLEFVNELPPVGGGGYLTKFNTGRLRPEVQPLTFLYTILAEKVPLLYTFY